MTDDAQDEPVLSGADRALLKSAVSPSDDQLAATRNAIGTRIAALAAGAVVTHAASSAQATGAATTAAAAGTATTASTVTTGLASLGAAKWIGAGLLVTAVASGVVTTRQRPSVDEHPRASHAPQVSDTKLAGPEVLPASAPTRAEPPQAALRDEPAAALLAPDTRKANAAQVAEIKPAVRRRSKEPQPVHAVDGETLSGELALLHGARQAIARGDSAAALKALDAHSARYPNAVLRQEALSARALALCEAGRAAEARRTAVQLARLAPRSPHLIRLADSCALDDTADPNK